MKESTIGTTDYKKSTHYKKGLLENQETEIHNAISQKHSYKGEILRASAIVAAISMASFVLTGCPKPIDTPPVEIPTEDPTTDDPITEDTPTDDPTTEDLTTEDPTTEDPTTEDPTTDDPTTEDHTTEVPTTEDPTTEDHTTEVPTTDDPTTDDLTTEDPTTEDPTIEDPTIETPTVNIANAPIVNAIRELGFGIDIVDVAPVEGLYTPETGDLMDLKFIDHDIDIAIQMQLDREKSTKDNLVYKRVKAWDTMYDEDVDAQDLHRRYFDKMTFDKENYSVSFIHINDDNTEHLLTTLKIELDENNKPSFIYNGILSDYKDIVEKVYNGEVFKPAGITEYSDIEIQLAK